MCSCLGLKFGPFRSLSVLYKRQCVAHEEAPGPGFESSLAHVMQCPEMSEVSFLISEAGSLSLTQQSSDSGCHMRKTQQHGS